MIVYFWDGAQIHEVDYNANRYPPEKFRGKTCMWLGHLQKPQYRDWTSQGWRITNEPDIPKELKAFALLLT